MTEIEKKGLDHDQGLEAEEGKLYATIIFNTSKQYLTFSFSNNNLQCNYRGDNCYCNSFINYK